MFCLHATCCTTSGNCPQAESQGDYGVISYSPFLWQQSCLVSHVMLKDSCLMYNILYFSFVVVYSIKPNLEPVTLSWPKAEVPPPLFLLILHTIHPSSHIPVTNILSYLIFSHKKLSLCSFLFKLFSAMVQFGSLNPFGFFFYMSNVLLILSIEFLIHI